MEEDQKLTKEDNNSTWKEPRIWAGIIVLVIFAGVILWYAGFFSFTKTTIEEKKVLTTEEKMEILRALQEGSSVEKLSITKKQEILEQLSSVENENKSDDLNYSEKLRILQQLQ